MSCGRSFPEIISVICPVLITVRGPSIKEICNKRRVVVGNGHPYKNGLCPIESSDRWEGGLKHCPRIQTSSMDGPKQN